VPCPALETTEDDQSGLARTLEQHATVTLLWQLLLLLLQQNLSDMTPMRRSKIKRIGRARGNTDISKLLPCIQRASIKQPRHEVVASQCSRTPGLRGPKLFRDETRHKCPQPIVSHVKLHIVNKREES